MTQTQNSVQLTGIYGDDERIALAGWTSTSRELTDEKRNRIDKFLAMLAEDHHGTPFEKSYIEFLLDSETASHIHLLKHRIAVGINGESGRYKELKADKYHLPRDWPQDEQDWLKAHCLRCFDQYHSCLKRLVESGMDRKRAKESARFYLPYSNSLTLSICFNFRSFLYFQHLRNSPHAQLEIREIAQEMLILVQVSNHFPLALEAYGYGESSNK